MKGKRGADPDEEVGARSSMGNQRGGRRTMESVAAWRGWGRATGRLRKAARREEEKNDEN